MFGYDFFISYCWADGRTYAAELHNKLCLLGFRCFLDSSDYAKGDHWRNQGKRALNKTSRLILVGTPKSVYSEPVNNELRIFTDLNRRIIPIDVNGSLSELDENDGCGKYLDADILRIPELQSALMSGPSESVIADIVSSFNLTRQDKKRLRLVTGAAVVFFVVGVIAIGLGLLAEQRRALYEEQRDLEKLARTEAEAATARSNLRLSQVLIDAGEFDRASLTLMKIPVNLRNWIWEQLNYRTQPFKKKWNLKCTVKGIDSDNNDNAIAFCFNGTVWLLKTLSNKAKPQLLATMVTEDKYIGTGDIDAKRSLVAFLQGAKAVLYDYSLKKVVYEWDLPVSASSQHLSKIKLHPTEPKVLISVPSAGIVLHEVGKDAALWKVTRVPDKNLASLSFSHNGKFIVMGRYPYIKLDAINGKRLISIPGNRPPNEIVWTKNNQVIGVGKGGRVTVIDASSFIVKQFWGSKGADFRSISTNNDFVLIGDDDGIAYLLSHAKGKEKLRLTKKLTGHDGSIQAVNINESYAFVGDKSSVTAWELERLQEKNEYQLKGNIWDIEINPLWNLLGVGLRRVKNTSCIQIINIDNNQELINKHEFVENICTDIDWSSDGNKLLSASGKMYVVYAKDGSILGKYSVNNFIQSVSFLNNDKTALLGGSSKIGIVRDFGDAVDWTLLNTQGSIRKIVPIKNTSTAVYITDSGYVGCFDWKNRKVIYSNKYFSSFGRALSVSEKDGYFSAGSSDGIVVIGQCGVEQNVKTLTDYNGEVTSIRFIDEDSILQVGYHDGVVAFYDMKSLELLIQTKVHSRHVRGSSWNKNNQQLFTADQSGKIKIWKTKQDLN